MLKAPAASGGVFVEFPPSTLGDVVTELGSTSGGVRVQTPLDFAGQVDLTVGSGSIDINLPLTIQGRISKRRVSGAVGEGEGRLTVRTGSGSIRVR